MIKLRGFIKYHSCIILPTTIFIICYLLNSYFKCFNSIESRKADTLASISASFIGVLITILTIYLAVPKNDFVKKRLKDSKHEHIYLFNILVGMVVFLGATIYWIFFDNPAILVMLFLSGITNIVVTIYYTFSLIKIL